MEIKLELKKEKEDEIFYRYGTGTFRFWFSQQNDGNIYTVHVAWVSGAGEKYEDFELFIHTNEEDGKWYPNEFILRGLPNRLTTTEAKIYMERMTEVCNVLDTIQEFFKTSFHASVGR